MLGAVSDPPADLTGVISSVLSAFIFISLYLSVDPLVPSSVTYQVTVHKDQSTGTVPSHRDPLIQGRPPVPHLHSLVYQADTGTFAAPGSSLHTPVGSRVLYCTPQRELSKVTLL